MGSIPTTRAMLQASGAACIAEVSSQPDDPRERATTVAYTKLSIWWIDDEQRPFIAVVEGKIGQAATHEMVDRFRAAATGTIERAIGWFDPSNLRDDLADAIPADAAETYPDANTLRTRNAQARRGYQGAADMREAAIWLFDGAEADTTTLARGLVEDFGIPFRTAFNALQGGALTGWAKAFIVALRYFDRGAWRAAKREAIEQGNRA